MDCHKILSLTDGQVSEFGSPCELLGLTHGGSSGGSGGGGLFHSLVAETGVDTSRRLMDMALEAHAARLQQQA